MPIITTQKLIDADKDADSLDAALNGGDRDMVRTRRGKTYPTMPNAIRQIMENGGFRPMISEAAIKAYVPTIIPSAAKDMTTMKIWWYGIDEEKGEKVPSWHDTGLSELERANALTNKEAQSRSSVIEQNDSDELSADFVTEDRFVFAKIGDKSSAFSNLEITVNESNSLLTLYDENGFEISAESVEMSQHLKDIQFIDFSKNIVGTTTYGQSLSDGITASPAISVTQAFNNVMLAGGVRTKPNETAYISNTFAPLIEKNLESPVSGFVNRLSAEITKKYPDVIFSGMSAGVSGQKIENLVKYTAIYKRYMQMIADTHKTAILSAKSFAVYFTTFKQGETNYFNSQTNGVQSILSHAFALSKLIEDSSNDIAEITQQDFKPNWLMSQTASHRFYAQNSQWIAIAIWRVAQKVSNAYLTYPDYFLPKSPDKLHLTSESSWRSGQYDAMCALHIASGKDWKPFHVKSVSWQSNVMILDCHVPVFPIKFSTTYTKQAPNQGFDIWENDELADIITSVEIIGDLKDKIKITCSREPAANAKLRIGFGRIGDPKSNEPSESGALTNVHDSNEQTVVSPLDNTFTLLNYLIIDEFSKGEI